MNEDREVSNFEKLSSRTMVYLLSNGGESIDWLQQAVDVSADRLERDGEFTLEESDRAKRFLKRDLALVHRDFIRTGSSFGSGVTLTKVGGGFADLADLLFRQMGQQYLNWDTDTQEPISFCTDEVSGPGTLICTFCGRRIYLRIPTRVPKCPECYHSEFRKSFDYSKNRSDQGECFDFYHSQITH